MLFFKNTTYEPILKRTMRKIEKNDIKMYSNSFLNLKNCMLQSGMILLYIENFAYAQNLTTAKTGGLLQACCGDAMLKANIFTHFTTHDNKTLPQLDFYGDILDQPNKLHYLVPPVRSDSEDDDADDDEYKEENKEQIMEVNYNCLDGVNIIRLGENKTLKGGRPWYQILSPDYPRVSTASCNLTFNYLGNENTMKKLLKYPNDLKCQFEPYKLLSGKATYKTVLLTIKIPYEDEYLFWASVSANGKIEGIKCSPANFPPMSFSPCNQSATNPSSSKSDEDDEDISLPPKSFPLCMKRPT
ncbi:unnamed protein product, partial [Owenia fusiformis]